MINSLVKERHNVLVRYAWIVVETHQAPSGCKRPATQNGERPGKLFGKEPGEPPFHTICMAVALAARCHRQGSDEAMAIAILKPLLHPTIPLGDATSRRQEKLDITEWCLMWIVEWHVAPPRKAAF
jgi:hypothetical protein